MNELSLTVNTVDGPSKAFLQMLDAHVLEEIRAAWFEPLESLLVRLIRPKYRQRLAAVLGCEEGHVPRQLVCRARAQIRSQDADDLFAAERTRIRIMDLIRAASHGVLTVLQQACQQDGKDDETAISLAAGLLCVRRNYRQAVKAFTGLEDTYDIFNAAHADTLLEMLRTRLVNRGRRLAEFTRLVYNHAGDVATEPLSRQIALILETIDFYLFEGDEIDLSSRALRDPDRCRFLLPLSDPQKPLRTPISREVFIANLTTNLTADGAELVRV